MTPKEAVESLMVKDPHSQTLKYLRKEGNKLSFMM